MATQGFCREDRRPPSWIVHLRLARKAPAEPGSRATPLYGLTFAEGAARITQAPPETTGEVAARMPAVETGGGGGGVVASTEVDSTLNTDLGKQHAHMVVLLPALDTGEDVSASQDSALPAVRPPWRWALPSRSDRRPSFERLAPAGEGWHRSPRPSDREALGIAGVTKPTAAV